MLQGSREARGPHEEALKTLLDVGGECSLPGVEAALASYDVPQVRALFDASILGKATAGDLAEAFAVTPEEAEAYMLLFFDRAVFVNDFHVIAWISGIEDEALRKRYTAAHTHGFRTLRFEFSSRAVAPGPAEALAAVLEADSRTYLQNRHLPLSDERTKELRALGKQVQAGAQALVKAGVAAATAPGTAGATEGTREEFVLQHRPPNPTLEELVAKGIPVVS